MDVILFNEQLTKAMEVLVACKQILKDRNTWIEKIVKDRNTWIEFSCKQSTARGYSGHEAPPMTHYFVLTTAL